MREVSEGGARVATYLLPVDDLESADRIDQADITGVQPTFLIESFLGVLGVLVVTALFCSFEPREARQRPFEDEVGRGKEDERRGSLPSHKALLEGMACRKTCTGKEGNKRRERQRLKREDAKRKRKKHSRPSRGCRRA